MDDDRVYHVKLHERGKNWFSNISLFVIVIFWGAAILWLFANTNRAPYLIDLNDEKLPATIDYSTRLEIIVRVETENGIELRLYDPDSGKLLGTIVEQSSNDD